MPKQLVNFYELKAVKKLMPKSHNPHFEETQIKIPSRVAFIGSTGSGKTVSFLNYLLKAQDTFVHIFVVYKESEALYTYLKSLLKENITFYRDLKDLPSANDLPYTNDGNVLLVFDDCVKDKDQLKIEDYMLRGRKIGFGITLFYLSQNWYSIPIFIRQQLSYVIIVKVGSDNDLKMILKEFSLGVNINELVKLYKEATKTFPSFFKIALGSPPNKMFSRNFEEFYTIKNEN